MASKTMTKKEVTKRDRIVFGKNIPEYVEGQDPYRTFAGLTAWKLRQLLKLGYADPGENQNRSPTIQEFLEFMDGFPGGACISAHGYVISPPRDDTRVSIEGLQVTGRLVFAHHKAFVDFNRCADEITFEENYMRSWWD